MASFPVYRQYPDFPCFSGNPQFAAATMVQMQADYLRALADMYGSEDAVELPSRVQFLPIGGRGKGNSVPQSYNSPQKEEKPAKSLPGSQKRSREDPDMRTPVQEGRMASEEKPIHGVNKDFKEFLEEELKKESTERPSVQAQKHEFLKRRSMSVPFQLRSAGGKTREAELEVSFSPDTAKNTPKKAVSTGKRELPSQSPGNVDVKRLIAENQALKRENADLRSQLSVLEQKVVALTVSGAPKCPTLSASTAEQSEVESRAETQTESGNSTGEGVKEVLLKKGGRKLMYPDGRTTVFFQNRDVKDVFPDGRVVYHFAQTNTVQTTFSDGLQIFKFSNGQLEKLFPDKTKEINFPDGTVKRVTAAGLEETIFPDGTVQKVDEKGVKHIDYVSGQKETVYTDGSRVREFPDGTTKRTAQKRAARLTN